MIKEEYIKPIPKYIMKQIEKLDKNRYDTRVGISNRSS